MTLLRTWRVGNSAARLQNICIEKRQSRYVSTYLERDVRTRRGVGEWREFDRFMRATALRTGQILSYADLARDIAVAPNTARAWMSVLVASGLVYLLEPYHRNVGKRLVKSPKLYLTDSGLACHLMGIDQRSTLLASPLAGPLWETFVVGQVLRHFQAARTKPTAVVLAHVGGK